MSAWEALTMEYLVTMTTHVPDETSDGAVQDIRTRESARSHDLATQGHLLRLWRPPLQPRERRTLGPFAADDGAELERTLASMPPRVWRTDEVTPLSPHPNDPARRTERPGSAAPEVEGSEFLTTFTVVVPVDAVPETADSTTEREADRARELAEEGHLERLWELPGKGCALGLWRAPDIDGISAILASLPLYTWTSVQITPLTPHPSDPALIID
jgi:muconolactone delta-isomerase